MFNVPEWGDDVPKNNIDLKKLFPKGKNKFKVKQSKNQANVVLKNNFKPEENSQPFNFLVNGKTKQLKKKKKKNIKNKQVGNVSTKTNTVQKETETKLLLNHIDIKSCDTDKIDEVIINDRKKKLLDSYKNDDNEETLFTEDDTNEERETIKSNQNFNKLNENDELNPKKNDKNNKRREKQAKINFNNKIEGTSIKNNVIRNTNKRNVEEMSKEHKNKQRKLDNTNTDTKSKSNETSKNIEEVNKPTKVANRETKMLGATLNTANNKIIIKKQNKKEVLKNMLQRNRNHNININSGQKLRERMLEKLNAAKFRFLNEKLYTSSGSEAQKLFQEDPQAFQTYHQGYQQQVKKWPINPLDVVVKRIKNMPKTYLIADMGCGEAALSRSVSQTVRSFDLVSTTPGVEVCDMARTPLLSDSMNVVVYCLALMGTDLTQYLVEANRVLKMGGHLLIAEVESRFDDVDAFIKEVQKLGFNLKKLDKTHKVFYFMEFTKGREAPSKKSKLPSLYLRPCIYKKR